MGSKSRSPKYRTTCRILIIEPGIFIELYRVIYKKIEKAMQKSILNYSVSIMKKALSILLVILAAVSGFGQELSPDFIIIPVDKRINEFPDQFDLSSPLKSCISFNYLLANGKEGLLRGASTVRIRSYLPETGASDSKVSEKTRNFFLNILVNEIVVYKDTVACAISVFDKSFYSIRIFTFENEKWVNTGEDVGNSVEDSRQRFAKKADMLLDYNRRTRVLAKVSTDTLSFTKYIEKAGQEPKQFVLNALTKHKLVIYGEVHRRLWSWTFCKEIIDDPRFYRSTGTIFMEISSDKQNDLDKYFAGDTMDKELLLNVFRGMQSNGWHDRGMYEFIQEVWKLDKTLPANKRIKIVAVDIPTPLSTFKTADEQKRFFDNSMDRNVCMAQNIEEFTQSKKDKRNSLFIVGAGHAYKSLAPGFASAAPNAEPGAGSLLGSKFPKGEVFSIFTHCPIISNSGIIDGRIRGGIFDYSFYQAGNKPVAFILKNSPFGREPFDAFPEISCYSRAGTFADNYDGYIFFGPLEAEPCEYILYDLYNDDFVREMERRAAFDESTVQKWFGTTEATKEAIIAKLKKENEGTTRWGKQLPPLMNTMKTGQKKTDK
jgi:hypothetical protein